MGGAVVQVHEMGAALGVALTDGQAAALSRHLDLLQRWNATYNLTAVRDPGAMRVQHLADCLAVVPALRRWLDQRPVGPTPVRLLDVGSGGGLPGVPFAVTLPGVQVTCVDAVAKKVAFLRQAAGELRLSNLLAVHGRVEELRLPPFDLVTSRAFASLADFVRWTAALRTPQGVWMAMKGRRPDDEIAALPATIDVFHVEPLTVPGLAAARCVVWMRPTAVP
jgi:16S rRNA (guanine527-N7)-methyltransferase